MKTRLNKLVLRLIALSFVLASFLTIVPKTDASTLTTTNLTEMGSATEQNPMIASDQQGFAIDFTTVSAVSTTPNVQITFPAGFTLAAAPGTPSTSGAGTACTSMFSGATAMPATLSATTTGQVLKISTTGTLGALTNYCTELGSTSASTPFTNNATPGQYELTVGTYTASTLVDSQNIEIDVLTSGGNAYTITGTVGPTFSLSEGGSTTDSFPSNLSSSAYQTSNGVTWTVSTNAKSGWFAWAVDSAAGLHSTQAGHTINTVATGSSYNFATNQGAENYGLGIYTVGGGTTAATNYTDTGHAGTGSGLSESVYNLIASDTVAASSDTFKTVELANISGTTQPATDYSDTITVIGAGSF
ncbi:MAG TPA: hypothetical protein VMR34_01200 [Candidatus Saccharimonadales bacterium]|nr:hypothetical protein [Candidatus Saccharimonadales bacterium]